MPSWDLPILQWARGREAVVGFAHTGGGSGEEPRSADYEVPAFDGIGANEYIVDVTHPGAVDFISAVDTPYPWELNIWYHTLNVGFRTRISGETDFPCITDERVGGGRTYAKLDRLTYRGWLDAVRDGRTYVSDGFTHLMDFTVNGMAAGSGSGEVAIGRGETAHVAVQVAALLDPVPDPRSGPFTGQKPYWAIERGADRNSRELRWNSRQRQAVARQPALADGVRREFASTCRFPRVRGWLCGARGRHTNPVFAMWTQAHSASRRSADGASLPSISAVARKW